MGFISSHIHEFAFPNPLCVVFFSSSLFHSIFIFQKRFWCGTIRWSRIFKTAFGRCSMSHECEFWATPKGGSLKFCLILVFCECVLMFFFSFSSSVLALALRRSFFCYLAQFKPINGSFDKNELCNVPSNAQPRASMLLQKTVPLHFIL